VHVDGEWTCPIRSATRHLALHDAVEVSRSSLIPFGERRALATVARP
jgi:DNA polymerase-3 subunit epsilon